MKGYRRLTTYAYTRTTASPVQASTGCPGEPIGLVTPGIQAETIAHTNVIGGATRSAIWVVRTGDMSQG